MSEQRTLASVVYDTKRKVTSRERFLTEMDAVIPWVPLVALVAPHYPKAGNGRRPLPLETMLRVYFLQQWFDLSDPKAEDMLYDSESMRRFARIDLGEDTVPDESTILRFRHLLETHELTLKLFHLVRTLLEEHKLMLKAGTIVDATIIAAPSSTKNATKTRDTLLHGEETTLYGDTAYWKESDRDWWQWCGGRYRVNRRGERTARWDAINQARSRVRARCEHVFRVVKCSWGFTKVRYRGLAKNTARAYATFALANLYLVRHKLVLQGT